MLYAIIDNVSQIVERVIVWDGKTSQNIPSGHTLIQSEFCRVGVSPQKAMAQERT